MYEMKIDVMVALRRRRKSLNLPSHNKEKCGSDIKKQHRASCMDRPTSAFVPQVNDFSENFKQSNPALSSVPSQRNRLHRRRISKKGYNPNNVSAAHVLSAPSYRAPSEGHTNKYSQKHSSSTLLRRLCHPSFLKHSHTLSSKTSPSTAKDTSISRWAFPPKTSASSSIKSAVMESEDNQGFEPKGWPAQPETPLTGKDKQPGKFSEYIKKYAKGSVENLRGNAQTPNRFSRFEEGGRRMLTRVKSLMAFPIGGNKPDPDPELFSAAILGNAHNIEGNGLEYPYPENVKHRTAEDVEIASRKVKALTGGRLFKQQPVPGHDTEEPTDEKEYENRGLSNDIGNTPTDKQCDAPINADDASTVYHPTDLEQKAAALGNEDKGYVGPEGFNKHAASSDTERNAPPSDKSQKSSANDVLKQNDAQASDEEGEPLMFEFSDSSSADSNERYPKYSDMKSGLRQHPHVMEFASPPGVINDAPRANIEPNPKPPTTPEHSRDTPNSPPAPTPGPTPEPKLEPSNVRFPFDIYVKDEPSSTSNISYAPSYLDQRSQFDLHLSTNDEVYQFLKRKTLAKKNGQGNAVVDFNQGDLGNRVTVHHPTGNQPQSLSATIEWADQEPIAEGSGKNKRVSVETKGKGPASEVFHSADEGEDSQSYKKKASSIQSFDEFSDRISGLEDPFVIPKKEEINETVLEAPEEQKLLVSPYRLGRNRRSGWIAPDDFDYHDYDKWDRKDLVIPESMMERPF